MADACKSSGVERFIWSSLPNVSKETNGELTAVAHFDSKASVEEYVRTIGVPASFFMPGLFMSGPAFKKVSGYSFEKKKHQLTKSHRTTKEYTHGQRP
jgi:hypothetical protein